MEIKLHKIHFAVIIMMLFFFCWPVFSQRRGKQLKAVKIKLDMKRGVTRSAVRGGNQGSKSKGFWGKIVLEYQSQPLWVDEVTVKMFVLLYDKNLKNKPPKKRYTMLKGDVTYINVEKGKGHIGAMFIHPNTLKRYGDIKEIRAELLYNGNVEDQISESFSSQREKKFLKNWWTMFTPKSHELLNRLVVPFVHDGDNAQEMLKTA